MKDKRISLRFREENEQEMEAWKCLEEYAKRKNISKNAALIALIQSAGITDGCTDLSMEELKDELVERIATAVAERLTGRFVPMQADSGAKEAIFETTDALQSGGETVPDADEPQLLGADALDFLDMFD